MGGAGSVGGAGSAGGTAVWVGLVVWVGLAVWVALLCGWGCGNSPLCARCQSLSSQDMYVCLSSWVEDIGRHV